MRKPKKIPRPTNFGANLKHLRLLKGTTQKGLAEAVGITRNKIATYEYGVIEPNVATLITICEYFGVPPTSMLATLLEESYIEQEVNPPSSGMLRDKLYVDLQDYISANATMTKIVEGYKSLQQLKQSGELEAPSTSSDTTKDLVQLLSSLLTTNWAWIESLSLTDVDQEEE